MVRGDLTPVPAQIRVLQRGDEAILMSVAPGVFDNPPVEALVREFLADPRHHIAVAIEDNSVVGFASAVHYVHPDKQPEMWINEVSVAAQHRGRGLAKALLRALFEVGRAHQCSMAWVLTYRNNDAATALYTSVGGTEGADQSGPANALVGYSFALTDA